jgi:hypothetical protein
VTGFPEPQVGLVFSDSYLRISHRRGCSIELIEKFTELRSPGQSEARVARWMIPMPTTTRPNGVSVCWWHGNPNLTNDLKDRPGKIRSPHASRRNGPVSYRRSA